MSIIWRDFDIFFIFFLYLFAVIRVGKIFIKFTNKKKRGMNLLTFNRIENFVI